MNERNFELVPIVKYVSAADSFKTEYVGEMMQYCDRFLL
jgi:hypothetical protein